MYGVLYDSGFLSIPFMQTGTKVVHRLAVISSDNHFIHRLADIVYNMLMGSQTSPVQLTSKQQNNDTDCSPATASSSLFRADAQSHR